MYSFRAGVATHDIHPNEIMLLPIPYILFLSILSSFRFEIVQEICQGLSVLFLDVLHPKVFQLHLSVNIEFLQEVHGFEEADGSDEGIYLYLILRVLLTVYCRSEVIYLSEE